MFNRNFFKKDEGHLAKTRKEQYGYILRNNISTLFSANIITFLFMIPLVLTYFYFAIGYHNLHKVNTTEANKYFTLFVLTGGFILLSTFLFNIGLIGLNSVIKQLVFESSSKISTFFKGIKSNFFDSLGFNFFYSLVFGLLFINLGFYLYVEYNPIFKLIILIVNCLIAFTLLLGKGYLNFEIVTFKNKTLIYIRNSIYLFYKNLPYSLIELVLILFPFLAFAFIPFSFAFIPLGFLATAYLGFYSLTTFMLSISVYERLFNKDEIKDIYHKGLEDINL